MNTEKLYYRDTYQKIFTATVLECQSRRDGYAIVLDRTCFYPEGGGQPGDTGTLNGIPVLDTHEKAEMVLHYTREPIAPGETVTGEICWQRRFDLMQQHSGEHMVSGVVHANYGYNNVGFHMGADKITIDFSGELTEAQLQEIEAQVNGLIWQNAEVRCWYPDPEMLQQLSYRSKKELAGAVRIVEFPGVDICACCGTHVQRTGEIGLVKLVSAEKFHGGVRVEMLSGKRAYDYLCEMNSQNRKISQMLSAKTGETAKAVARLSGELEQQKQRLFAMENAQFAAQAEVYRDKGNVCIFMEGLAADGVRRAAIALQETCGGRAAVFSGDDTEGYKYAVGLPDGDLRSWVKTMNGVLHGRGGGKPGFVQGSVQATQSEIQAYLERN